MSLRDRMLNETLSSPHKAGQDARQELKAKLRSHHSTSSGESSNAASTLDDQELQTVMRIFQLLENSCITGEALNSLIEFQDAYLRKHGIDSPRQVIGARQASSRTEAAQTRKGKQRVSMDKYRPSCVSDDHLTGQRNSFMDRLLLGSTKSRNRKSFLRATPQGSNDDGDPLIEGGNVSFL